MEFPLCLSPQFPHFKAGNVLIRSRAGLQLSLSVKCNVNSWCMYNKHACNTVGIDRHSAKNPTISGQVI